MSTALREEREFQIRTQGCLSIGIDASCWVNKRGHGRYTRELVRALLGLDQRNYYWLFLDAETARQCEDLPQSERTQQVVVTTSQAAVRGASVSGHRSVRDLWAMSHALRQHGKKLDILYFPSATTVFPVTTRAKTVVTIHDAIPQHYPSLVFSRWNTQLFWRLKLRYAIGRADVIATVSQTAKRDIMRAFRLDDSDVKVIPGAANPLFHALNDRSQSRRVVAEYGVDCHERFILYVGGLNPHKNLAGVIDAYAALIGRPSVEDVKFVIAGDFATFPTDSNYRDLRAKVVELGLAEKIIFTGYLSDLQLLHFFNAAELLVLASLDEGFGLPALEAMTCGTPVVASRAGALPEVIGEAGQYFNPRVMEELTMTLHAVLTNRQLREAMSRHGLRRAQAFSWERSARAALAVFEKLTGA